MSESNASPRDESQPAPASARRRKPRPSRGKGLRTTTGCIVCRTRHMKCDEKRPTCSACFKSKRECIYVTTHDRQGRHESDESRPSAIASPALPRESAFEGAQYVEAGAIRPPPDVLPSLPYQEDHGRALHIAPPGVHAPDFARQRDDHQTSSPRSSLSGSTAYAADIAPLRWFGLLAGDATNAEWNLNPISPNLLTTQNIASSAPAQYTSGGSFVRQSGLIQGSYTPSIIPHEAVTLSDQEVSIFRYFVTTFSRWIDLTDPHQHFSVMVPHLALRNQGLMKAILALCARHLSLKPIPGLAPDRTLAVLYYYETLQYLQQAMKSEAYLRSEELLVTTMIISTYEMIDGEGKSWERHLRGIFWVQRSREINGESGGLSQAIWWAWLRQDVWAAFREGRKVLSFFKPTKPYYAMDHWDIAARCVYLVAQCVNYSSEQEIEAGKSDLIMRLAKADELSTKLEDWYQHLTSHFNPLPCINTSQGPFKPIWIHPLVFGVGLQMYHFAKILLQICTPAAGGLKEYMARERALNESIDVICGIALATDDDAAIVISTQCIFAAGLHTQDPGKRVAVLGIIAQHQARTGWPVHDLRIDLEAEWSKTDNPR
ncbi:hypothetical protein E4T38_03786 [Aureobasidium subglaciale]|nr:hypothetical protein E4T38_03786 [Aureobasidium subglaciale]KAI5217556.1 hypothetical protein E4T41_08809 [Aureobasidium subglaciale]KAI5225419.1 hypothetical protein E4T40_03561 [Aureobasidium subglaciale]KAI5255101.1 hypothetical protein E4T46_08843 [Aureobasidium subglaciale]